VIPGAEDIPIGSSWRSDQHVYVIQARGPVEPGCPAWGARQLVLAVPRGEDPHPLDRLPDTWLWRYLTPLDGNQQTASYTTPSRCSHSGAAGCESFPRSSGTGQPREAWLALLAVKPKTAPPGGR